MTSMVFVKVRIFGAKWFSSSLELQYLQTTQPTLHGGLYVWAANRGLLQIQSSLQGLETLLKYKAGGYILGNILLPPPTSKPRAVLKG